MVVLAFNLSSLETEADRSLGVQVQSGLDSESSCLRKKKKKETSKKEK